MLSDEARAEWNRQRTEVDRFFAGDRCRPLLLPHHDGFCVCDMLTSTALGRLRFALRYIALGIICRIPIPPLKVPFLRMLGMKIGKNVFISPGVILDPLYPSLIELEDDVLLGMGSHVLTHEHTATGFRIGKVRICQGAVIGAWATVRAGVTVGRKVTVGCNSFVNKDVPDGLVVGGVPAKPLKQESELEQEEPLCIR